MFCVFNLLRAKDTQIILNRKPNDKLFDKHESKEAILDFYVMPYNAKCYIL